MPLSDRDRAILEFERLWWRYPGAKEAHVRDTFDLSITAYYVAVNRLLDDPAALEHDPLTVRRLQRRRSTRARVRRSVAI